MNRVIIHVDMDAFFASVEIRERPELAGRPVIVGGTPEGRGVVAAASYAARRFGIHSAMPTATALRLCPQALLLPPRHALYAEVSAQIHAVFARYTPQIEPISLDEAFLDVSASERLFGPAVTIGRGIKQAIRDELGLVASVGIAPNKFLAKLASDIDKPDGFFVVDAETAQAFLDPLPVTRLWGVGPVAARQFERLGVRTVGQLRAYPKRLLAGHFGNAADHLWGLAHGVDERPVEAGREAKSISQETTFATDIADRGQLLGWLQELTDQVCSRLRCEGLKGRTVTLKLRYADFTTLTRAQTRTEPTDLTSEVWQTARQLYRERVPSDHPPVRLVGVGVSGFAAPGAQPSLFDAERQRAAQLDSVLDGVRARFGPLALRRGRRPDS
jgi:DNA polymerase-4